jgi:hypothetical protein
MSNNSTPQSNPSVPQALSTQVGTSDVALKNILDRLVVDCGEEYHKLHSGQQDFDLTNGRMNYYENEAIKQITALFPVTEVEKEVVKVVTVVKKTPNPKDYKTGYNSGYIAGTRKADTKGTDLPTERPEARKKAVRGANNRGEAEQGKQS